MKAGRAVKKFLAVLMIAVCASAYALELPENIGGWHSVSKYILPLITEYNQESQGTVTYMTYQRESPPSFIEAILSEGAGAGSLYIPPEVNTDKGMMPADSGFELLKVSGHDAIIESRPFMPLVLAVNVADNITLNLESPSAKREELIRIAEDILSVIQPDSSPAP